LSFDISQLPVGCDFTLPNVGDDSQDSDADANGLIACFELGPNEIDESEDVGLLILTVNIGDYVWHDIDGDGIQDGNEPGIPDVTVFLYNDENDLIGGTLTDQNGFYTFEEILPDTYYLIFEDPEGYTVTFADQGNNDANDSDVTNFVQTDQGSTTDLFTLIPGQDDDFTFDAGYYICTPIGELVWYDVNENDIWEEWENGINGLPVNLYRLVNGSYVLYESTTTGHKPGTPSDDGYFKFCAPPGTYYVEVVMPPIGLVRARYNQVNSLPLTNANEPTNDSDLRSFFGPSTTSSFSVLSGDMICNIGAGFYPMGVAGNRVWDDANFDGYQDADEANVEDVLVEAFEAATGDKVGEAVTNSEGMYSIDYLGKEDYYLKFTPPTGYGFTEPNASSENTDSDVDHSNGLYTTKAYSMSPGETKDNIDAGIAAGVLPVEWLAVNAVRVDNYNLVTWSTGSEVNSSHFVLERKIDNGLWTAVGKLQSATNTWEVSNYSMEDTDADFAGLYYYRIQQVDLDGTADYSDLVSVDVRGDVSFDYFPNPTLGKVNIKLNLPDDAAFKINIYDTSGRLIREGAVDSYLSAGKYEKVFDMDGLEAGVYTMRVIINSEVMHRNIILVK